MNLFSIKLRHSVVEMSDIEMTCWNIKLQWFLPATKMRVFFNVFWHFFVTHHVSYCVLRQSCKLLNKSIQLP